MTSYPGARHRGRLTWLKGFVIVSLAGLFLGGVLTVTGGQAVARTNHALDNGEVAVATVVEVSETISHRRRGPDKTVYTPLVRYRTIDGDVESAQLPGRTDSSEYAIGETVEIIYDRTDPQNILKNQASAAQRPYFTLFTGIFALCVGAGFGIGALIVRSNRRR